MKATPTFQDADAFYENLLNAHQGLSREESEAFNARLILVMAHQIGLTGLLNDCLNAAIEPPPQQAAPQPARQQGGRPVG